MDKENSVDIIDREDSKHLSFFSHVFSLSSADKSELYNIIQYSITSVPLIVLLIKLIQYIIPKEDENKNSLELVLEIVVEVALIYLGVFFIDRIVSYISTFSKSSYKKINLLTTVVPILLILLSLQTHIGLKANMVYKNIFNIVDGKINITDRSVVKVSQPLSNTSTPSRVNLENNKAAMPNVNVVMPQQRPSPPTMQVNSGGISSQPMVQQPQQAMETPLLAANEALGGSFGSAF